MINSSQQEREVQRLACKKEKKKPTLLESPQQEPEEALHPET